MLKNIPKLIICRIQAPFSKCVYVQDHWSWSSLWHRFKRQGQIYKGITRYIDQLKALKKRRQCLWRFLWNIGELLQICFKRHIMLKWKTQVVNKARRYSGDTDRCQPFTIYRPHT